MTTLADVRTALAEVVETACGWKSYAYAPLNVVTPCVIPSGHEGDVMTMDGGRTVTINMYALVAIGNDTFQERLDELVEPTSDKSILDAINANPTLGLEGVHAVCNGWDSYGSIEWAGAVFWSVRLPVIIEM